MDEDFELPEDLTDDIEVVYLDEEEEIDEGEANIDINEIEEFVPDEAGIGESIEADVIDLSQATFQKHKGSVFSGDLSPDSQFAATGGEDDMAYIWTTQTAELFLECTGHKDSINEVAFSHDGQYVCTGDMSGLIQVWSMNERKLVWCYESDDLEWLLWHHMANVLFAGSQSGDVYVWQIPQGNCKVLASHGAPTSCGKVLADGKRLLVGYGDGQLKLWDIKNAVTIWQLAQPQSTGVTSLDVNSDNTLIVLAPTSQLVKTSDGKTTETLLTDDEKDVEAVAFNSDLGIVVTGSLSGQLCVWDVAKKSIRHQAKIDASVTVLKWGLNGKLFVGATDGAVYVCDARAGTLIETLTGHRADVLSVTVSKDGRTVLTTSDDGSAKVFVVKD